jgi:hypothetical protein
MRTGNFREKEEASMAELFVIPLLLVLVPKLQLGNAPGPEAPASTGF